jgi:predicted PurR-regulated permease PerM
MTVRERAWWWVAIVAVFVGFIWLFKGILLPFVAGMAIAYFLDPIADRLERLGLGRGISALITLIGFFLIAVLVVLLLIPMIQNQVSELSNQLPTIVSALQNWLTRLLGNLQSFLSPAEYDKLKSSLTEQVGSGLGMLSNVLKQAFTQGVALFEFISVLVVTPVVAFYQLRDWDKMIAKLDALLPREHKETVHTQMKLVDDTLAGFVRGQSSVCVLLGLGYGAALAAVGLPFGFTVGLTAGLVSFIPYLGSIFGLVSSVGLALLEFSDEPIRILMVAAIFLVGQAIEGNYLTPKLVGERVRLHPVWVIFALFAGGSLLGFLGMLIALPVAAVLGVLVRFLVDRYQASRLFDQEHAE